MTCKYYPCHQNVESCTYCYCPAYPCGIPEAGGKFSGKVWDCSDCELIHKMDVVQAIKTVIIGMIKELAVGKV